MCPAQRGWMGGPGSRHSRRRPAAACRLRPRWQQPWRAERRSVSWLPFLLCGEQTVGKAGECAAAGMGERLTCWIPRLSGAERKTKQVSATPRITSAQSPAGHCYHSSVRQRPAGIENPQSVQWKRSERQRKKSRCGTHGCREAARRAFGADNVAASRRDLRA